MIESSLKSDNRTTFFAIQIFTGTCETINEKNLSL